MFSSILYRFFYFNLSKSIIFFSVLLFSYSGFNEEYVIIESTLAFALLLVPLIGFGLTSSYTYYKLNNQSFDVEYLYWEYLIFTLIVLGLATVIFYISSINFFQVTSLLIVILGSRFISHKFKIKNDVIRSSSYDCLPYLGLMMVLIGLSFNYNFGDLIFICCLFLGLILIFIALFYSVKHQEIKLPFQQKLEFYKFGWKALGVSSASSLVILSPRAFAPEFIDESALESFYLTLRYASLLILPYQFLVVSNYNRMHKIAVKKVIPTSCICFLVGLIGSVLVLFFVRFIGLIPDSSFILFAAGFTGLWVSSSFLEYFINRESATTLFFKILLMVFPLIIFFLWVIKVKILMSIFICITAYVFSQAISIIRVASPLNLKG